MYFRKEKCSEEDTSNNKEVKVPAKPYHQVNALGQLRKMEWLQNQNDHNHLSRYFIQKAP
jgi:hypothetical protein